MANSTSTTYRQGITSADYAANTAVALGINPGSPIYYDMEHYNSYVPGCNTNVDAVVASYLNAFVTELVSDGYVSGVYESSSNLAAVFSDGNSPSDAWAAGGAYTDRDNDNDFDPCATVWDNSWIGRDWTYDDRLYQYTPGHYETWGGVTLNIDSDSANGDVTPWPAGDLTVNEGNETNEYNSPYYDDLPC